MARLPTSVLVFNREVKNKIYIDAYMNELKDHNRNIIAAQ